jgi:hypothetical protein
MTQPNAEQQLTALLASLQAQNYGQQAPIAPPTGYQQMPSNFTQHTASAPPAPPKQAAVAGSLAAMFEQPNAGAGPSINPTSKSPVGTTVVMTVARDVSDADVRQNTSPEGTLLWRNDGSPQFLMVVPVIDAATGEEKGLYVSGPLWTKLNDAMHTAGYPANSAPRGGDTIAVKKTGEFQNRNRTMSNRWEVLYQIAEGNKANPYTGQQTAVADSLATSPEPSSPLPPEVSREIADFTQQTAAPTQAPPLADVPVATVTPTGPADLSPDMAALLQQMTGG